jgi:hypothetical protein
VTNTAFATYNIGYGAAGPFTAFNQGPVGIPDTLTGDYTLGMQFSVSTSTPMTGIWWYSCPEDTLLPTYTVVYNYATEGTVPSSLNTAPTWSGTAGSGWVKCDYSTSGVTLATSTNYVVCVSHNGTFQATPGFGDNITNGPLFVYGAFTAPFGDQDIFYANSGGHESPTFPNSGSSARNYWVDVEVTPDETVVVAEVQAAILASDGSFVNGYSPEVIVNYGDEKWQVESNIASALQDAEDDDTLDVRFLQ